MADDLIEMTTYLGREVQRFAGKTVLISGGAGFLGRHFVALFRHLNRNVLKEPCKVISVDNYLTGDPAALTEGGRDDVMPVPLQSRTGAIAWVQFSSAGSQFFQTAPDIPVPIVLDRRDNAKLDVVISNSFGFGGTNATLVFQRYSG